MITAAKILAFQICFPICLSPGVWPSASLAQLVEQLICNQQVVGSNPTAGFMIVDGMFLRLIVGMLWYMFPMFFYRPSELQNEPV